MKKKKKGKRKTKKGRKTKSLHKPKFHNADFATESRNFVVDTDHDMCPQTWLQTSPCVVTE